MPISIGLAICSVVPVPVQAADTTSQVTDNSHMALAVDEIGKHAEKFDLLTSWTIASRTYPRECIDKEGALDFESCRFSNLPKFHGSPVAFMYGQGNSDSSGIGPARACAIISFDFDAARALLKGSALKPLQEGFAQEGTRYMYVLDRTHIVYVEKLRDPSHSEICEARV